MAEQRASELKRDLWNALCDSHWDREKKIFEKLMPPNSPNLMRNINLQAFLECNQLMPLPATWLPQTYYFLFKFLIPFEGFYSGFIGTRAWFVTDEHSKPHTPGVMIKSTGSKTRHIRMQILSCVLSPCVTSPSLHSITCKREITMANSDMDEKNSY